MHDTRTTGSPAADMRWIVCMDGLIWLCLFQLREPVSRGKKLKPEQTTKHGQLRGDSPKQFWHVLRVIAQSDQMRTFPVKLVGIRDFPNATLAHSSNLQENCHDVSIPSRSVPRRNVRRTPGVAKCW